MFSSRSRFAGTPTPATGEIFEEAEGENRLRRPRQRSPRKRDERHLNFVRQLPCLISGRTPVEAAHIRYSDPPKGKPNTGMGEKPDDRWTVPLHPEVHRAQHAMGERRFWQQQGIDPCAVALMLHAVSGNIEEGLKVVTRARKGRTK